jgi:hypothetical protein
MIRFPYDENSLWWDFLMMRIPYDKISLWWEFRMIRFPYDENSVWYDFSYDNICLWWDFSFSLWFGTQAYGMYRLSIPWPGKSFRSNCFGSQLNRTRYKTDSGGLDRLSDQVGPSVVIPSIQRYVFLWFVSVYNIAIFNLTNCIDIL